MNTDKTLNSWPRFGLEHNTCISMLLIKKASRLLENPVGKLLRFQGKMISHRNAKIVFAWINYLRVRRTIAERRELRSVTLRNLSLVMRQGMPYLKGTLYSQNSLPKWVVGVVWHIPTCANQHGCYVIDCFEAME